MFVRAAKSKPAARQPNHMERDKGIEPSPRPWQGRVLPLYESRCAVKRASKIYNMRPTHRQGRQRTRAPGGQPARTQWPKRFRPRNRTGRKSTRSCCRRVALQECRVRVVSRVNFASVDFHHARRFDHRRALLALSETRGAFPVDVHARELFTIFVINRYLPMAVFAASVVVEPGGFS